MLGERFMRRAVAAPGSSTGESKPLLNKPNAEGSALRAALGSVLTGLQSAATAASAMATTAIHAGATFAEGAKVQAERAAIRVGEAAHSAAVSAAAAASAVATTTIHTVDTLSESARDGAARAAARVDKVAGTIREGLDSLAGRLDEITSPEEEVGRFPNLLPTDFGQDTKPVAAAPAAAAAAEAEVPAAAVDEIEDEYAPTRAASFVPPVELEDFTEGKYLATQTYEAIANRAISDNSGVYPQYRLASLPEDLKTMFESHDEIYNFPFGVGYLTSQERIMAQKVKPQFVMVKIDEEKFEVRPGSNVYYFYPVKGSENPKWPYFSKDKNLHLNYENLEAPFSKCLTEHEINKLLDSQEKGEDHSVDFIKIPQAHTELPTAAPEAVATGHNEVEQGTEEDNGRSNIADFREAPQANTELSTEVNEAVEQGTEDLGNTSFNYRRFMKYPSAGIVISGAAVSSYELASHLQVSTVGVITITCVATFAVIVFTSLSVLANNEQSEAKQRN